MLKDETNAISIANAASNVFANPFEGEGSISLSTGLQVKNEVENDLILAEEKGTEATNALHKERLLKEKSVCFFDTLKKLKLKTFQE